MYAVLKIIGILIAVCTALCYIVAFGGLIVLTIANAWKVVLVLAVMAAMVIYINHKEQETCATTKDVLVCVAILCGGVILSTAILYI